MVDQIKSNIASTSKSLNQSVTNEAKKNVTITNKVTPSMNKTDSSSSEGSNISKFINKEAIKGMSNQPPIDKEKISRIKSAIANNAYPIDLEKISDALMDAYKEMK